jgi:hypothetical protein
VSKLINYSQVWALNKTGRELFDTLVKGGMDVDLAFEFLNIVYSDAELYQFEEDGSEEIGKDRRRTLRD